MAEKKSKSNALDFSEEVIDSTNLLTAIGWTYSILDLKLKDDEYYALALAQSKKLRVYKHEDKGSSAEVSGHYNNIYDQLQNKDIFVKALKEFREDRNFSRRNASHQSKQQSNEVRSLKAEIERLTAANMHEGFTAEQLLKINKNLKGFIAERGVKIYNRNWQGAVTAASLSRVDSIKVLTMRFSGGQAAPKRGREDEYFFLVGDLFKTAREGIPEEFRDDLDTFQWGPFMKFLERFVKPTMYVFCGIDTFEVEHGHIAQTLFEIKGCNVIGTLDGASLPSANLKINRHAFASLSKIGEAINPYIINGKFLVIDRAPKQSIRDDLTRITQELPMEDAIHNKLVNYEFARNRPISTTDLVVIGMVIGIN